jgi:hypothetical protein
VAQTARDTITRALVMLGISLAGRAPTAVEASDGLKALNGMMHGWKAQGVDVGHIDLALSDYLALAPEHHEAVTALLAVRLSTDYEVPIPQGTGIIAANGWSGLQAAYITNSPANDLIVESGLRRIGRSPVGTYYP